MVRGKFKLNRVSKVSWSPTVVELDFGAVCNNETEENQRFSKYTPTGRITMTVDNPSAAEQFELGKEYYVDFNKID